MMGQGQGHEQNFYWLERVRLFVRFCAFAVVVKSRIALLNVVMNDEDDGGGGGERLSYLRFWLAYR